MDIEEQVRDEVRRRTRGQRSQWRAGWWWLRVEKHVRSDYMMCAEERGGRGASGGQDGGG